MIAPINTILLALGLVHRITGQPTPNADQNCNPIRKLFDSVTDDPASRFLLISPPDLSTPVMNMSTYQSKRTGLIVGLGDTKTTNHRLSINVITEPWGDAGEAHSLEHMIFFDSQLSPYPRHFYEWAHREGLKFNAATGLPWTIYFAFGNSLDSLLQFTLLYMDHIFRPILKEETFTTEVHFVDGDGFDKGIAYNEMVAYYSNAYSNELRELNRIMNPATSAYYYASGGYPPAMRQNLTLDSIKEFHKKFYKPQNSQLTLTGNFDIPTVLRALSAIEDVLFLGKNITIDFSECPNAANNTITLPDTDIALDDKNLPINSPLLTPRSIPDNQSLPLSNISSSPPSTPPSPPSDWREKFPPLPTPGFLIPPAPLNETKIFVIDVPAATSESATIIIANWVDLPRTPLYEMALEVLDDYLSRDHFSPFYTTMVTKEKLATEVLSISELISQFNININLYGVAINQTEKTYKAYQQMVQNMYNEKLKLSSIHAALNSVTVRRRSTVANIHSEHPRLALKDFLYHGKNGTYIRDYAKSDQMAEELKTWTQDQWTELFGLVTIKTPQYVLISKYSTELANKIQEDEKLRAKDRASKLSPDQQKAIDDRVKNFRSLNKYTGPPQAFLPPHLTDISNTINELPSLPYGFTSTWKNRFTHTIPEGTGIQFNKDIEKMGLTGLDLPILFFDIDGVSTRLEVTFRNLTLSQDEYHLFSTLMKSFFDVPYEYKGQLLNASGVRESLNQLSDKNFAVVSGPYTASLTLEGNPKQFADIMSWVESFYFGVRYDKESLKSILETSLLSAARSMVVAATKVFSVQTYVNTLPNSPRFVNNDIISHRTIARSLRELNANAEDFINKLNALRSKIIRSEDTVIIVRGPIKDIPNIHGVLKSFSDRITRDYGSYENFTVPMAQNFSHSLDDATLPVSPLPVGNLTIIMPYENLDSSEIRVFARGRAYMTEIETDRFDAFLQFLSNINMPLLEAVRVSGLAYALHVYNEYFSGLISCSIIHSTDPVAALTAVRAVAQKYATGASNFTDADAITATNFITSDILNSRATSSSLYHTRRHSILFAGGSKTIDPDEVLRKPVKPFTSAELNDLVHNYVVPLFSEATATSIISCPVNSAQNIAKSLSGPSPFSNFTMPPYTNSHILTYDQFIQKYVPQPIANESVSENSIS